MSDDGKSFHEVRQGLGVGVFEREDLQGVDAGTDGVQPHDDVRNTANVDLGVRDQERVGGFIRLQVGVRAHEPGQVVDERHGIQCAHGNDPGGDFGVLGNVVEPREEVDRDIAALDISGGTDGEDVVLPDDGVTIVRQGIFHDLQGFLLGQRLLGGDGHAAAEGNFRVDDEAGGPAQVIEHGIELGVHELEADALVRGKIRVGARGGGLVRRGGRRGRDLGGGRGARRNLIRGGRRDGSRGRCGGAGVRGQQGGSRE